MTDKVRKCFNADRSSATADLFAEAVVGRLDEEALASLLQVLGGNQTGSLRRVHFASLPPA
jgi:hypothetical protein